MAPLNSPQPHSPFATLASDTTGPPSPQTPVSPSLEAHYAYAQPPSATMQSPTPVPPGYPGAGYPGEGYPGAAHPAAPYPAAGAYAPQHAYTPPPQPQYAHPHTPPPMPPMHQSPPPPPSPQVRPHQSLPNQRPVVAPAYESGQSLKPEDDNVGPEDNVCLYAFLGVILGTLTGPFSLILLAAKKPLGMRGRRKVFFVWGTVVGLFVLVGVAFLIWFFIFRETGFSIR